MIQQAASVLRRVVKEEHDRPHRRKHVAAVAGKREELLEQSRSIAVRLVSRVYDPGDLMPTAPGDFAWSSWLISWPDGPWHLHDVEVGGTVLLVDSGPAQRIVWETRVTHSFGVPLEMSPWGDKFGMCVDKFGVAWMVNIAGAPADATADAPSGAATSDTV